MRLKSKPEMKPVLHPLCAAVKELRKGYGDSLEQFSRRLAISITSASRFELGKAVPKDPVVLLKLARAAADKGLSELQELFEQASREAGRGGTLDILRQGYEQDMLAVRGPEQFLLEPRTLAHIRYLAALRLAVVYSPETLPALERALAAELEIVDEALQTVQDPTRIDYPGLDLELTRLAERKQLTKFQQRKKDQQ
jgi:transcriptional regulator with XRE-family HTH domain